MNADDFKLGLVVQLNSGGCSMTITGMDSVSRDAKCSWFTGEVLHEEYFPVECLVESR